jgi:hypothetical protein
MAKQFAEKVIPGRGPCPQRLKPNSKQGSYRSGKTAAPPKIKGSAGFFRKL